MPATRSSVTRPRPMISAVTSRPSSTARRPGATRRPGWSGDRRTEVTSIPATRSSVDPSRALDALAQLDGQDGGGGGRRGSHLGHGIPTYQWKDGGGGDRRTEVTYPWKLDGPDGGGGRRGGHLGHGAPTYQWKLDGPDGGERRSGDDLGQGDGKSRLSGQRTVGCCPPGAPKRKPRSSMPAMRSSVTRPRP